MYVCTGPEDNASAMAMITEAAVAYDKTSPASFSLDAFEGATMTPLVFKEQLRRYDPSSCWTATRTSFRQAFRGSRGKLKFRRT